MDGFEIILAFTLSLSFLLLLWAIRGVLLRPAGLGKHCKITILVYASGPATDLEQEIRGLCWLRRNGSLYGSIVIVDDGMEPKAHEAARLLCRDDSSIHLCRLDETEKYYVRGGINGGKK